MVENSNTSYKNEIHRLHSSFNKDSKTQFFCQGDPNFEDEWLENLGKQPNEGNLLFRKFGNEF